MQPTRDATAHSSKDPQPLPWDGEGLCTITKRIGRQQKITGHTMRVIVVCKKAIVRSAGLRLTGSFTKETRSALARGYKAARRECGEAAVRKLRFELCTPPHDSKLDGPSATEAAVVAMLSLASHRRLRTDVAITGDVGPTGRIRKVGCIRRKGARRRACRNSHCFPPH
uniref:Lon proteolytic domain-containing protein n=1 Tax=Globodera rostochiensis TaxID=31243 RepID=A0A914GW03_GLORO